MNNIEAARSAPECRLCLQPSSEEHSLLSENVIEMVENLTNIKLVRDERLPPICCAKCLVDLEKACQMKERIVRSQEILQLHLQNSAIEFIKIEEPPDFDTERDIKMDVPEVENSINEMIDFSHKLKKLKFPKDLRCEHCDVKFEDGKTFRAHLSKHNLITCPVCDAVVRSDNFKRHSELHNAKREVCEICGKTAKNKESLRGHMFYQHRENAEVYKCEQCNRVFRYKCKYKLHILKTHIGERNHQCEICGKKFFTVTDTKKHIEMTHQRQRPYVCSFCSRGFSSAYALKTHVLRHTQETPFRCEICAAGFRQKICLKLHLKSKHNAVTLIKNELVTEDADKIMGVEDETPTNVVV